MGMIVDKDMGETLVVQTTVSLPPMSMFQQTPAYQLDDGTIVFGLRLPVIIPDNSDMLLVISGPYQNRLDLVASQYERQDAAWWCLADATNLIDPLFGTPQGTRLRLPQNARLPN